MYARMVVLAAMLVAGCGGGGAGSLAPGTPSSPSSPAATEQVTPVVTQTPSPTPTPTPTPRPTPQPTPAVDLDRFSLAEVVTEDLRVRTLPSTGDESMRYTPLLQPGDLVFVTGAPAFGDGYTWYPVRSLLGGERNGPTGWVAVAGPDGEIWVADRIPTECPDVSPGAPPIRDLVPEVFLACFGDETIEFSITGDLYCEGGGGIIPAWFITDCEIAGDATAGRGTLRLVMNPATGKEVGRGGSGTWALIGHFGDPAAETCVADGFLADRTTSDELVHLCRTTFVLDTPPTKL